MDIKHQKTPNLKICLNIFLAIFFPYFVLTIDFFFSKFIDFER